MVPTNKVNWVFEPSARRCSSTYMQDYFVSFWGLNRPMMDLCDVWPSPLLRQYCKEHHILVYYNRSAERAKRDEDRALLAMIWGPGLHARLRKPAEGRSLNAGCRGMAVLVKWRYSALHRSPLEQMLKIPDANQLIITGVYAHIGCMTTATDALYARH